MRIDNNPQAVFGNGIKEQAKTNIPVNKNFLEDVQAQNKPKKELEEGTDVSNISNVLSIPKGEDELSFIDQIKKHLIENVFSFFNKGDEKAPELFPTKDMKDFKFSQEEANPYSQSLQQFSNGGFVYEATQEYYQKTTIDFSTQATIKTPKGEYNIELNISFTHEFYAKRTTQIAFDKPIELQMDKDDDSLKNLKKLDLVFGLNEDEKDKNKDLFHYIKELLIQHHKMMQKQEEENKDSQMKLPSLFDSFKVWEKNEKSQFSLLAAGQEGVGVFMSNSQSSSSYMKASSGENGFSYEAGYSTQTVSTIGLTMDIKA